MAGCNAVQLRPFSWRTERKDKSPLGAPSGHAVTQRTFPQAPTEIDVNGPFAAIHNEWRVCSAPSAKRSLTSSSFNKPTGGWNADNATRPRWNEWPDSDKHCDAHGVSALGWKHPDNCGERPDGLPLSWCQHSHHHIRSRNCRTRTTVTALGPYLGAVARLFHYACQRTGGKNRQDPGSEILTVS